VRIVSMKAFHGKIHRGPEGHSPNGDLLPHRRVREDLPFEDEIDVSRARCCAGTHLLSQEGRWHILRKRAGVLKPRTLQIKSAHDAELGSRPRGMCSRNKGRVVFPPVAVDLRPKT
jgi:hypothetical protein